MALIFQVVHAGKNTFPERADNKVHLFAVDNQRRGHHIEVNNGAYNQPSAICLIGYPLADIKFFVGNITDLEEFFIPVVCFPALMFFSLSLLCFYGWML